VFSQLACLALDTSSTVLVPCRAVAIDRQSQKQRPRPPRYAAWKIFLVAVHLSQPPWWCLCPVVWGGLRRWPPPQRRAVPANPTIFHLPASTPPHTSLANPSSCTQFASIVNPAGDVRAEATSNRRIPGSHSPRSSTCGARAFSALQEVEQEREVVCPVGRAVFWQ
jgi:hypothetical protein